jgi:hypothetical protein
MATEAPIAQHHLVPTYPMPDGIECSWCGADYSERLGGKPFCNREGETFCCKNHRDASTRALHRLQRRFAENPTAFKVPGPRGQR